MIFNAKRREISNEEREETLEKTLRFFNAKARDLYKSNSEIAIIDLKNDSLIGAIIVGTGLPQVCFERELLKEYFDRRGESGFDYAYRYPGMNKVLQAAGRVIRTEEDKGVVALLDERFLGRDYKRLFPREWEDHVICRADDICEVLEDFWNG